MVRLHDKVSHLCVVVHDVRVIYGTQMYH